MNGQVAVDLLNESLCRAAGDLKSHKIPGLSPTTRGSEKGFLSVVKSLKKNPPVNLNHAPEAISGRAMVKRQPQTPRRHQNPLGPVKDSEIDNALNRIKPVEHPNSASSLKTLQDSEIDAALSSLEPKQKVNPLHNIKDSEIDALLKDL